MGSKLSWLKKVLKNVNKEDLWFQTYPFTSWFSDIFLFPPTFEIVGVCAPLEPSGSYAPVVTAVHLSVSNSWEEAIDLTSYYPTVFHHQGEYGKPCKTVTVSKNKQY